MSDIYQALTAAEKKYNLYFLVGGGGGGLPNLRVTQVVCDWHPFRVVLGRAYRGLTGEFLLLRNFSVTISVSPHVCFILVLILICMFLR